MPKLPSEARVACNDKTSLLYYAITINICIWKRFRSYSYKKYQELNIDQQKHLLKNVLMVALDQANITEFNVKDINYELTLKDNVHIHTHCRATPAQMEEFAKSVHEQAGFPKDPVHRICYYTPTEVHHSHWEAYEKKERPEDYIPNRSMLF